MKSKNSRILDVRCKPEEIGHLKVAIYRAAKKLLSVAMSKFNNNCMMVAR
jgi:hypothetical protein